MNSTIKYFLCGKTMKNNKKICFKGLLEGDMCYGEEKMNRKRKVRLRMSQVLRRQYFTQKVNIR